MYCKIKAAAYYQANKERLKALRDVNKEQINAYWKAYSIANRKKISTGQKAYREANKEQYKAYQKAYRDKQRKRKTQEKLIVGDDEKAIV